MKGTQPGAEQASSVYFYIERQVTVPSRLEVLAKTAIRAVWQTHMDTPTALRLRFANRIYQPGSQAAGPERSSLYDPTEDRITLALSTMDDQRGDLPLDGMVVLHAGYEARHMVQFAQHELALAVRGPNTSADGPGQHEHEAWQSALEAFGAVYPNVDVTFTANNRVYSTMLAQARQPAS